MTEADAADRWALLAFEDTAALARRVGVRIGAPVRLIEVHRFPDGESLVRAQAEGADRAWVFRSLDRPNEKLVELLLASDALRRQGVGRIGLVTPYLAYMRQDRVFSEGEPVSQQAVARLLDSAFDEVLTVEAHLHRIRSLSEVFEGPAESISAAEPVADWLREQPRADLLVGPDAESEPWVRAVARRAGLDWRIGTKERRADRDVRIELPALPAGVRSAWIVDDIASSGTTLERLVRILKERGVEEVGAIVVHALLDDETPERLGRAGLDRLVSTDGIAHSTNAIPLAPLLAEALSKRSGLQECS